MSWLGRNFRPGGGLPALTLTSAGGSPPSLGDVRLEYDTGPFASEVALYLWHRSAWRHHARTRFGRLVWHEHCVRTTRVKADGGFAVLYAGYAHRQARCGRQRPGSFLAHVFLDDTVSINPVGCWSCRDWGGPYDSLAGMRAVVRGLRPRP